MGGGVEEEQAVRLLSELPQVSHLSMLCLRRVLVALQSVLAFQSRVAARWCAGMSLPHCTASCVGISLLYTFVLALPVLVSPVCILNIAAFHFVFGLSFLYVSVWAFSVLVHHMSVLQPALDNAQHLKAWACHVESVSRVHSPADPDPQMQVCQVGHAKALSKLTSY